jgi:hypothetical protein
MYFKKAGPDPSILSNPGPIRSVECHVMGLTYRSAQVYVCDVNYVRGDIGEVCGARVTARSSREVSREAALFSSQKAVVRCARVGARCGRTLAETRHITRVSGWTLQHAGAGREASDRGMLDSTP